MHDDDKTIVVVEMEDDAVGRFLKAVDPLQGVTTIEFQMQTRMQSSDIEE